MQRVTAAAFLLLCAASLLHNAAGQCVSLQEVGMELPGSLLKYGHVCPAERGWRALRALWAPFNVAINCSTSHYTVVTASSEQQLATANVTAVKWCGLKQLVSEPTVCHLTLSPLHDQYLAVEPGESNGFFGTVGPSEFSCEVESMRELSPLYMALTAAGVLLFFNAAQLSMSTTFRLTSGSLMFVSGAVVVLAFLLMRSVPYKRSLVAFFTVSSTSMMAAVRWLYGTWLPDLPSLLLSRPFLVYVAVTGLLGLAVTYWMDDTSNVKLNTTIRVTLRLAALAMVYSGISDERVGLALTGLLVASGVLAAVARRLALLVWLTIKHTTLLLRWVLHSVWRLVWRSRHVAAAAVPADRTATATVRTAAGGATAAGLATAAGSALPDDAEPLLSDEEEEQAIRRRRSRQRQPPAFQEAVQEEQPPLSKVGSFRDWAAAPTPAAARAAAAAAAGGERSPIHLRQGAPLSPTVLACQPDLLQQQHWRQQEVPMRQQAGASTAAKAAATAAAAAAGEDAGGYQFPSSKPSSSPWSNGKLVMDVSNRVPVSSPPAPLLSAAMTSASPAAAAAGAPGSVSPLVQQGKIMNPLTSKAIAINKATYNQLISQGYQPDLVNGVLVLPGSTVAAGASSGGRPASGVVTPSSQARQRSSRLRSAAVASPQ